MESSNHLKPTHGYRLVSYAWYSQWHNCIELVTSTGTILERQYLYGVSKLACGVEKAIFKQFFIWASSGSCTLHWHLGWQSVDTWLTSWPSWVDLLYVILQTCHVMSVNTLIQLILGQLLTNCRLSVDQDVDWVSTKCQLTIDGAVDHCHLRCSLKVNRRYQSTQMFLLMILLE